MSYKTIPDILEKLRKTSEYSNQSDYYIKKNIGIKYNLKSVKKVDLIKELESLNKAIDLPNDILYQILLNADVTTIKSLCMSNNYTFNQCQSTNFWINKFNHNDLPLIRHENTMSNWINNYTRISDAAIEVKQILTIMKLLDIKKLTIFYNQVNVEWIKFLNQLFNTNMTTYTFASYFYIEILDQTFTLYLHKGILPCITYDIDELYKLLIEILFINENVEIAYDYDDINFPLNIRIKHLIMLSKKPDVNPQLKRRPIYSQDCINKAKEILKLINL